MVMGYVPLEKAAAEDCLETGKSQPRSVPRLYLSCFRLGHAHLSRDEFDDGGCSRAVPFLLDA
jgi:hypothetical protein